MPAAAPRLGAPPEFETAGRLRADCHSMESGIAKPEVRRLAAALKRRK